MATPTTQQKALALNLDPATYGDSPRSVDPRVRRGAPGHSHAGRAPAHRGRRSVVGSDGAIRGGDMIKTKRLFGYRSVKQPRGAGG
jgi:hypothetical protein